MGLVGQTFVSVVILVIKIAFDFVMMVIKRA
jgi:hypothetical protein